MATAVVCSPLGFSSPLGRSIERALEDAAASGALCLSGRKLREYPRCAGDYDLADVTDADLSKNRLVEIPIELCQLVALESLQLYHNAIRSVPPSIHALHALFYLNISRNQLSSLPVQLCRLPLRVLVLGNNKIGSLPPEIGDLKNLHELDVSCNELQELPPQLGNLVLLRELNVRRNRLEQLPEEISELPLVSLDFSCNCVVEIPMVFRKLHLLETLAVDNNPLKFPPAHVCVKGRVHILKYLSQNTQTSELPKGQLGSRPVQSCDLEKICLRGKTWRPDSGIGSESSERRLEVDDDICPDSAHEPSPNEAKVEHFPNGSVEDPISHAALELFESLCFDEEFDDNMSNTFSCAQVSTEKPPLEKDTCISNQHEAHKQPHDGKLNGTSKEVFQLPQSSKQKPDTSAEDFHLPAFGLKPRSAFSLSSKRGLEGLKNGNFTVRRRMEQMREEMEQIEQLRQILYEQLCEDIPEDLGAALQDGVILCRLVNRLRPRTLSVIHEPSPAVPQLSMAKCRRNVDSFLEGCCKLGVPKEQLCLPHHILEEKGIVHVGLTVRALIEHVTGKAP
uniref:leucine-rich repeat and calponin homology domain-containing protein 1-like isoform X2 n=1 Tax=Myxine glutinosa TaxID=7769 RepID=UPI00358F054D